MAGQSDDKPADGESERLGADLIIPALACLLTGYYFASTSGLVWESRAMGVLVGGVLICLCCLEFGRIAFRVAAGRGRLGLGGLFTDSPHNRQRLFLTVLVVLFIATIQWLGTTLGLFLLLAGSLRVLGVRDVRTLLAVAVAAAAAVYSLLILLLNTRLPRGPLEKLLAAAFGAGA